MPRAAPTAALALPIALAACSGGAPTSSAVAPSAGGCALVARVVLPLRLDHGNPVTTIWVNGQPAEVLFDTGAGITILTPVAAQRLGLQAVAEPGRVWGTGGGQDLAVATVSTLAFGQVRIEQRRVAIAATAAKPGLQDFAPDGSLGDDLLHQFEVDLDLPHGRATLYGGHPCAGALPGWTARASAVPFERAFPNGWQVAIPATLDGQPVRALIDSGAQTTVVSAAAALHGGLPTDELASDLHAELSGVGLGRAAAHLHRFKSLQVGDETLDDVETAILPLPFRDIGLVLGSDFLQTHKVWISYGTGKVYLADTW